MASTQTMTIPQFLNGTYKVVDARTLIQSRIIPHLKKHKVKYRIIGTTIIVFLAATAFATIGVFAESATVLAASADPSTAVSSTTGIDIGGRRIYAKLLSVGKWTIILKGAWDTIHAALKSDTDTAKKNFLSYAMVYLILLAFPWVMDQIDSIFQEGNVPTTTIGVDQSDMLLQ